MPTATTSGRAFVVDRAGFPLFITWRAAASWLTLSGRALQCPDCGEVHDSADDAFACCDMRSAYPVLADVRDGQLVHNVTADELAAITPEQALEAKAAAYGDAQFFDQLTSEQQLEVIEIRDTWRLVDADAHSCANCGGDDPDTCMHNGAAEGS